MKVEVMFHEMINHEPPPKSMQGNQTKQRPSYSLISNTYWGTGGSGFPLNNKSQVTPNQI